MSPSQQNKEEQKLEKEQEEEEEDLIVCPICANVLQVYTCRINSKSSPVCYTYCTECNQFLLLSEVDALKLEKNNKKKKVRKSLQEKIEEINKTIAQLGGGIYIHCTDYIQYLWQRCQARGEDYITDIETLAKIKECYGQVLYGFNNYVATVEYRMSTMLPISSLINK